MNKILVIGLGGTIGSVKKDSIGLDRNNLKILDYVSCDNTLFEGVSPFSVLSENMTIPLWKKLVEFIDSIDFSKYTGVIILHGSDTLAFTSSIIANAFPDEKIVLVAADKPIEDKDSNGISNFENAVWAIIKGIDSPLVSYDGIFRANCITSADINDRFVSINSTIPPVNSKTIYDKNILIINPYVGINLENYNLKTVDAVLVSMYHSATVPKDIVNFWEQSAVPVYFVTHKSSADYETAQELDNIIFGCTIENAYARLLLTK